MTQKFFDTGLCVPHMVMIGATGRNAGKTEFACALVRKESKKHTVVGLKVTTIRQANGTCPRGGLGCGVCSSLSGDYCLTEEADVNARGSEKRKDTARLLRAGAKKVYWLRVKREALQKGMRAALRRIGKKTCIVCESNSARTVVVPGVFVVMRDRPNGVIKTSCAEVIACADAVVSCKNKRFSIAPQQVEYSTCQWRLRMPATAVILAGGKSTRMGTDKALLRYQGKPLIAHVAAVCQQHVQEVIISSNDPEKYRFLKKRIVLDSMPGQGPLAGIIAGLRASTTPYVFVCACDTVRIRRHMVTQMLSRAYGFDAVIPCAPDGFFEPLFAVYKRTLRARIERAFNRGVRSVRQALTGSKVLLYTIEKNGIFNINTPEDYQAWCDDTGKNRRVV